MTKFATIAALILSTSAAFADGYMSSIIEVEPVAAQCYDVEHFADIMEYSEDIRYIGSGLGEVDGLGYQWEYDIIQQGSNTFVAVFNPYENTTCVEHAVPGKRYQVTRG